MACQRLRRVSRPVEPVAALLTDPEYVAARRVLLDALEALADHRQAIVLVGAQAVYVRTETLADYQPYTTDADLAVDPTLLEPLPGLEDVMRSAGFRLKNEQFGHPSPVSGRHGSSSPAMRWSSQSTSSSLRP